jgi:hypothetical protein
MTAEQVADEVIRAWKAPEAAMSDPHASKTSVARPPRVGDDSARYPPGAAAVLAPRPAIPGLRGARWQAQQRLRDAGIARHVYVITDEQVAHHYEDEVEATLRGAEIRSTFRHPPGEASKTLRWPPASTTGCWNASGARPHGRRRRRRRRHGPRRLRGGHLRRGLPLVHVPTSPWHGDASIGGKSRSTTRRRRT